MDSSMYADLNTTFVEDNTAFFHDIQIVDDEYHVIRNAKGEEIRLGDSDEVLVEPYQTNYPSASQQQQQNQSIGSDFESHVEDEIEVPRGYATESLEFQTEAEAYIKLEEANTEKAKDCDDAKVEEFYNNIRSNPEWARSLAYVKLNATVAKHLQYNLITHAYLKVNERPKYLTMLTKSMDAEDITKFVKMAFECTEIPVQRTLFRLYCRNAVPTLKSLLRAVLTATSQSPEIEVEYSDVLGEIECEGKRLRMKTADLKSFCKMEDVAQTLGLRLLTTLNCRSKNSGYRTLDIRYYDEKKRDGVRVTYVHMDHETRTTHASIRFSDISTGYPYYVDSTEMVPLSSMYPPVLDLVKTITKLSLHVKPY